MIEFKDVCKEYGKIKAVNNINIKINDGEFVFLVGHSGAGKSTLIKLIQREVMPTSGLIYVDHYDISLYSNRTLPKYRRKIGTIFQDFRLLNNKNVAGNIAFAMKIIGKKESEIKRDVPKILKLVGLYEKQSFYPGELSGGEQQRVAIARAIVNRPKVLLADEPTGNLDIENSVSIMKLLEAVNMQNTTVIVATHNLNIVNLMKKRVIRLDGGKIASDVKRGKYINE